MQHDLLRTHDVFLYQEISSRNGALMDQGLPVPRSFRYWLTKAGPNRYCSVEIMEQHFSIETRGGTSDIDD